MLLFHLIPTNFHFYRCDLKSDLPYTVWNNLFIHHNIFRRSYGARYSMYIVCETHSSFHQLFDLLRINRGTNFVFVGLIVIRFFPLNSAVLLSRYSLLWNAAHEQVKITWKKVMVLEFRANEQKNSESMWSIKK